ncbi:hypothetical protein OXE08_004535 [Salmonella enterica]|nr:hypothetical protein [Salmonella enterica]
MGRAKYYREIHELRKHEQDAIKRAFKRDYQGAGFRDKFMISRDCLRTLKEESRVFML